MNPNKNNAPETAKLSGTDCGQSLGKAPQTTTDEMIFAGVRLAFVPGFAEPVDKSKRIELSRANRGLSQYPFEVSMRAVRVLRSCGGVFINEMDIAGVKRTSFAPFEAELEDSVENDEVSLPSTSHLKTKCPDNALPSKSNGSVSAVVPANEQSILRTPICCPLSYCNKVVFVSDFNQHIVLEHVNVPHSAVLTGEEQHILVGQEQISGVFNTGFGFFLVNDKVKDLGSGEYKDYLPAMLLGAWLDRTTHCDCCNNDSELLVLWLAGVFHENTPTKATLIVWDHTRSVPCTHCERSGDIYSLLECQHVESVYNSDNKIALSRRELHYLTNGGREDLHISLRFL